LTHVVCALAHPMQPVHAMRIRKSVENSLMKTILDIDDELLAQAKARAALERKSLTRLIEEGLSLRLKSAGRPTRRSTSVLPVFTRGTGLRPGIDPTSNQSMLDAADAADAADASAEARRAQAVPNRRQPLGSP